MTAKNSGLIESALTYISAQDRDTWVRMAMAIKSELGEAGFSIWDNWSKQDNDYNSKDALDVWKGIDASGKVGIGTLYYEAKQNGFHFKQQGNYPKPNHKERAERRRQHEAEAAKAQENKAKQHAEAAKKAQQLWANSHYIDHSHPYLQRKHVEAFGLRCCSENLTIGGMNCQDSLVIPLYDNAGQIHSLQFINIAGEKRFLPKAAKRGFYGLIQGNDEKVLVCEGYATGASLHQATGYTVAIAFDASNLLAVTQQLIARYPSTTLVICADDDHQATPNTGLLKATETAKQLGLSLAVPDFGQDRPNDATDFNDLHRIKGLEVVKHAMSASLQPMTNTGTDGNTVQPEKNTLHPQEDYQGAYFYLDEENPIVRKRGVYYVGLDKEGEHKRPQQICGVLKVVALTNNANHRGHGFLLAWIDRNNRPHRWAMPAELFKGDGSDVRGYLLDGGLFISPHSSARNLLSQYIQTQQSPNRVLCVNKTGWQEHGDNWVFVTPHKNYGKHADKIVFQSEIPLLDVYKAKGTLQSWQREIAALCVGNSRLAFAISCAFAGVLLKAIGEESGGFHFRGASSLGKSTAQHVASSVWGGRQYKRNWRSTIVGIETTAATYNDGLLILDEIGQADPKEIGETIYMLANGQGKNRGSKSLIPRSLLEWRLLFLSSGELSLNQHMQAGGKTIKAGQELRLADIPADTESGHGLVETLHHFATSKDLIDSLNQHTQHHYGTAGIAFLEWATQHHDDLTNDIRTYRQQFLSDWLPKDVNGQVARVAGRFALVAAAGEIASKAGITGWQAGEAAQAARLCFTAWLRNRGTTGSLEREYLLQQVRRFLEQHGESRFSDLTLNHNTAVRTTNRLGYREPDGEGMLYYVLPEAFKEIIAGHNPDYAISVLLAEGWLKQGEGRNIKVRKRLPEGNMRVYCLLGSRIFDDED